MKKATATDTDIRTKNKNVSDFFLGGTAFDKNIKSVHFILSATIDSEASIFTGILH